MRRNIPNGQSLFYVFEHIIDTSIDEFHLQLRNTIPIMMTSSYHEIYYRSNEIERVAPLYLVL